MAVISEKWYERGENVPYKSHITEVHICSSLPENVENTVSWDASVALDGSVMAYLDGTTVYLVCAGVTSLPKKMFSLFISLNTVTGLGNVISVGDRAFWRCHALTNIDLDPEMLELVGNDAFRMSAVEDSLNLDGLADDIVGARATRKKRWGADRSDIETVWQNFAGKHVELYVPNPDCQILEKYKNIFFILKEYEADGVTPKPSVSWGGPNYSLYDGCSRFALYHMWQILHAGTEKEYADCEEWFAKTLNKSGEYAHNTEYPAGEDLARDFWILGWEIQEGKEGSRHDGFEYLTEASQLGYILGELSKGLPVYAGLKTGTANHAVVIVGFDHGTRKLAVVDSGAAEDRGVIFWCAFEDLFIKGVVFSDGMTPETESDQYEGIFLLDFKPNMLAKSDEWYTQAASKPLRSSITEIEIAGEYVPSGNEAYAWNASAGASGGVMAYVNGTKLTLAYQTPEVRRPDTSLWPDGKAKQSFDILGQCDFGYDCLYANPNSSWVFSDSGKADYFTKLETIHGADRLNTSRATTMERMFRQCGSLADIDVSNWNTSNVTSMYATFDRCLLSTIAVDDWDISSVTTFSGMFMGCGELRELNLSKWDTSAATSMDSMFYETKLLEKLSVGEKFSFGDAILHTPSADNFPHADGFWYDKDYNAYMPSVVQGNVARTYYATKFLAADDSDEMVLVRNGTLRKIAVSTRHKNGGNDAMLPSEFADDILSGADVASVLSNLYYFEVFKAAIDGINQGDISNYCDDPSADAVAVGYEHNGHPYVVLLKDATVPYTEEPVTGLNLTADMTLVLNGHTLSCDPGVTIALAIQGGNVTIDGRVPGSMILNEQTGSNRASAIVLASGTLRIDGGAYQCAGESLPNKSSHGCIVATADITVRNAKVQIYGESGYSIGMQLSGNAVMENCDISAINDGGYSYAVKVNNTANVSISNSLITAGTTSGYASTTTNDNGTLNMNNCKEVIS